MPYNRNIFKLDLEKLTRWLTEVRLRTDLNLKWLYALVSPLIHLYNRFMIYRHGVVYKLNITPQVCYLEKALNDKWDVALRRIRIVDPIDREAMVLFRKVEAKKQVFYRKSEGIAKVLWTKSETAAYGVDFIIQIPLFLPFDYNELKAFLDSISKLTTKTYRVQLV